MLVFFALSGYTISNQETKKAGHMSTVSKKHPKTPDVAATPGAKKYGRKDEPAMAKLTPSVTAAPVSAVGSASAVPTPQATPAVVDTLSPVISGRELRKKELFDLVTARSGMKKKDVKPVVEAMLAVLGEALKEHREMHLKPLGKVKIQRAKDLPNGQAIIIKVRQNNTNPDPVSSPEE